MLAATSFGGSSNQVSRQEADILLTVGLYHLTSRALSRSAFLSRGSAQTALGVLTGATTSHVESLSMRLCTATN